MHYVPTTLNRCGAIFGVIATVYGICVMQSVKRVRSKVLFVSLFVRIGVQLRSVVCQVRSRSLPYSVRHSIDVDAALCLFAKFQVTSEIILIDGQAVSRRRRRER